MKRILAAMLVAIGLSGVPMPGLAQADAGSGSGQAPHHPAPLGIDIRVEGEVEAPFFAHEPFGFGPQTLRTIADDSQAVLRAESGRIRAWAAGGPAAAAQASVRWVLGLLVVMFAAWVDRRLRGRVMAVADSAAIAVARHGVWIQEVARTVIVAATAALVPTVLWFLFSAPTEIAGVNRPWLRIAAGVTLVLAIYRASMAATLEVLDGRLIPVEPLAAARLRRAAVSSFRFIALMATLWTGVAALHYRDDAVALARFVFRVSVTLLSLRLLTLQAPILTLLPTRGDETYLRFRAVFASALRWMLLTSTALLGIWTAGFERAAGTILLRSWALIALVVGGVLAKRWFDEQVAEAATGEPTLMTTLLRQTDSFARACINIGFAMAVLALLGLLEPLKALLEAIRIWVGTSPLSLLDLLRFGAILGVAVLVSRVLRTVLDYAVYPWLEVDEGGAYAANTALSYFIGVLALGIALINLGIDLSALAVFAGALGVGLGFGLQDFARNLISGFTLLFGRSVEKGDLITVENGETGYVQAVGARAVRLQTRDNYEVIVPTSMLVASPVINWTHSDPHIRLHLRVGVSYKVAPNAVREALLAAAARVPHNTHVKAPDVWLVEFGDSAVIYELLVWIDARATTPDQARGKALFVVFEELHARGMEIPYPQRDLHIRSSEITEAVAAAFGRSGVTEAASTTGPRAGAASDGDLSLE